MDGDSEPNIKGGLGSTFNDDLIRLKTKYGITDFAGEIGGK